MQAGNGAEPILEVKNLKTHLVYPSPGPSRHLYGGHPKGRGAWDGNASRRKKD